MDVQSAANLNIPEGSVRNIHDKDKRLLWSAVGYNVRYDGNTTQQTYIGKNLASIKTSSATVVGGLAFTIEEGTIKINGTTSQGSAAFFFDSFQTGNGVARFWVDVTGYTDEESTNAYIILQVSDDGSSWSTGVELNLKSTAQHVKNITLDNSKYYRIRFYVNNNTFTNSIIKVQLEYGTAATSFEPYVGGIPSPNPDYPQAVNVVKGVQNVKVTGKNLFSFDAETSFYYGDITQTHTDNAVHMVATGTTGAQYVRVTMDGFDSAKTYCMGCKAKKIVSGTDGQPRLRMYVQYSDDGISWSAQTAASVDNPVQGQEYELFITFSGHPYYRFYFYNNTSTPVTIGEESEYWDIQLEEGFVATDFEQYQGQVFPVGLIGKNLFSGWIIGKRINSNGVEVDDQNSAASDFIPVAANTNYTFSDIPDGLYTFIAAYNSQKQFLGRTGASGGSSSKGCKTISSYFPSGTPTGTGDIVYLRITAYPSSIYTDPISVVSSLQTQLEVGTSATPYVPYYNYELCKIDNYQDYIFKSSGKNLFDGVLEVGIINGVTGLDQANNNYVRAEDYIPVEELTYYRISTDNTNISSVFVYEYKADKTYNLATNKSLTLTDVYRTEEGTAFIRFRPNYQTADTSIKFQVEKGTVATPYEPYGTDWYVCEKMGKLVFNGSENWAVSNSGTVNFYYALSNLNLGFTQNTQDLVSNYGLPGLISNTNTEQGIIIISASGNQLRIRYGTEMTVASWQSKLSTTNMVLYYARKTPTYTKITDTTLIGQLNAVHDWLRRYDYYGVVSGNLPIIINRSGII